MKISSGLLSLQKLRLLLEVQKLKQREAEVKAHEMAHKLAAGSLAGPVRYQYTIGPDGKRYIVGGEVPLKVFPGRNPEETLKIARKIKRAALAPLHPSAQDRMVALKATLMEFKALNEIMASKNSEDPSPSKGQKIDVFV